MIRHRAVMRTRHAGAGITRRTFLQGTGATLGALGLSALSGGSLGCDPPAPDSAEFYGAEMVGRVGADRATVRLVGGDLCTPSTQVQLLYDAVPRQNPGDYAFARPAASGFGAHAPIDFELDALEPGSRCYYRVGIDSGDGWTYRKEHSFVTRRHAGSSFRFCVSSDMHVFPYYFADNGRRAVYDNIAGDGPDLLLTLGDEFSLANQRQLVYSWPDSAQILDTTRKCRSVMDHAGASMCCLPVNGNHEGLYGWFADTVEYQRILDAKLAYFPVPDDRTFLEGGDPLGRYGAFLWGSALFVWLDVVGFCPRDPWMDPQDNAGYVLGAEQRAFLENVLDANASAPWKFIFSHHLFGGVDACGPGYGRGNANAAGLHEQAFIQDLMQTYGVQAFFYGHDHVYSVSQVGGVSYICAGNPTSGCVWVPTLQSCYPPCDALGVDEYGAAVPGHVRVDVGSDTATVSYVKQSWGADNAAVWGTPHVLHL